MTETTDNPRRLQVEILGPVRAVADGTELRIGGPRQQALLAAPALEIGRAVSVDALADAVWEGSPPEAVDRTFKTYEAKLRKALAAADGVDGTEGRRRGARVDAEGSVRSR